VDLLYNGGIGTYVRASSESDREVMDPANDSVRISADQLRCRVVGEGGNLGFTQRARIEFAMAGGRINTDAIDNSAGVDMSDHEVNLKILFASRQQLSLAQRNRQLKALTETVTAQCLANNLNQSRSLSLAEYEARQFPPRLWRLRDRLLAEGRLNTEIDPGMDEDGCGVLGLRPQLAVLLGHEKNRIKQGLAKDAFAAQSCFRDDLMHAYFPDRLRRRWEQAMHVHPLADDIVHTMAANHLLDQFGLTAMHHLQSLQNAALADFAQTMLVADYILDGATLRQSIWDGAASIDAAIELQHWLQEYLLRFAEDMLRLCPVASLGKAWMIRQRSQFRRFRRRMAEGRPQGEEASVLGEKAAAAGLGKEDAAHMAALPELAMSAVAMHLAAAEGISLIRALRANQACLRLLPFLEVDRLLRSATWGEEEELHALRCEWLHRMTLLRSQAVGQLLAAREKDFFQAGLRLWQEHRHWPLIQEMRLQLDADTEQRHTHLLLLLARMEAIVREGRNP
jgi:glutamate dehydrogenase